jgi:dihydroorotate dehydrogenase (fumarate)
MDTRTSYLGFQLDHPFIAGASPFGASLDSVKRLEDAGIAAVVLHSLFEEQITFAGDGRIRHMDPHDQHFSAALADYPAPSDYPLGGPDRYAEHIHRLKQAVRVPVIASLNGTTAESWLTFGRLIEQAGADALELNLYEVVTDLDMSSSAIEEQLAFVTTSLKETLRIPIAVKVSPFFAAFGNVARRLDQAGADAIVLFNRFYQPDIETRSLKAIPTLEFSTRAELRLRLRWLAILHGRVRASLAVTGGVESGQDAVKAILAGAHVVQVVSALLRHGPGHLQRLRDDVVRWMIGNQISDIDRMRGCVSLKSSADPANFERASYIHALHRWTP